MKNGTIDEFLMLSELAEQEKVVCVEFYESELARILNDIQAKSMGKLRLENQVRLEKSIGENSAIYIAFKIKDPSKTTTIMNVVSNDESLYFARIEIFSDFQVKLSTHTEMNVQPVISKIDSSDYFEIQIRFVDGRVKLIHVHKDEPDLIAEISLSLKSRHQSDIVKFDNLDIFDIVYHENCGLKKTYHVNKTIKRETPKEVRDFERSIIEQFSPWNGLTDVKQLSFAKKTDWAENFMFHVFGREKVDFDLQYKYGTEKAFGYEIKDNTLIIGKMRRYWVPTYFGLFGYFQNSYGNEDPVKIPNLPRGVTLNSFPKENEDNSGQNCDLEMTNQTTLANFKYYPCSGSGQSDCYYSTNRVEITSQNSSISGFRYMDQIDYLTKLCFLVDAKSIHQETLPYLRNCAAIETPWNLCSSPFSPENITEISPNVKNSVARDEIKKTQKVLDNFKQKVSTEKPKTVTAKQLLYEHTVSEIFGENPGIISCMVLFFIGGLIVLIVNVVIVILLDFLSK
ncbi:unnamed protein product [Caenorhabditis angaria]|uniref:Uncharacterized protein n=1 Tax=Caenorhabditis angaria TaxID=860376 RepID=A0A9P1IEG0_9PELO|nr:unnamed protein product [Caenorhabditis angaria]